MPKGKLVVRTFLFTSNSWHGQNVAPARELNRHTLEHKVSLKELGSYMLLVLQILADYFISLFNDFHYVIE